MFISPKSHREKYFIFKCIVCNVTYNGITLKTSKVLINSGWNSGTQ